MRPASQVRVQAAHVDAPVAQTLSREEETEVPYYTPYYQERRGCPLMKEKAQSQQYLSPPKEKALVNFILQISAIRTPIYIKYYSTLTFYTAYYCATNRPNKLLKKSWP